MPDRDLLEIFDAVLPRLEPFGPGSVPGAGSAEAQQHEHRQEAGRTELALYTGATGAFGLLAWLFWSPWLPMWLLITMCLPIAGAGLGAMRAFLRLAFGQRLEQALPPGTDAKTAQLEDGTWSLIREWNYDAFFWNGRADDLRTEVSDWQRFRTVPESRDIEWSEQFSATQAESLIEAIRGLAADRMGLIARRREIEHRLRALDDQLRQLQAEESQTLALPPSDTEDPPEE